MDRHVLGARSRRMPLSETMNDVPTSATTAIHSADQPVSDRPRMSALKARLKRMFCQIVCRVVVFHLSYQTCGAVKVLLAP